MNNSKVIIVISGPDGCGKSHIIKNLILKVPDAVHFHIWPKYHIDNYAPEPLVKYNKTYGILMSVAKLVYIILLFHYYYVINIFLKKKKLFIFDRYLDEVIIDPKRFRINLPRYVLLWIKAFIVQPDCRFLIKTDYVNIMKKGEITKVDAKEYYSNYTANFKDAVIINNDFQSYDAIDDILFKINQK